MSYLTLHGFEAFGHLRAWLGLIVLIFLVASLILRSRRPKIPVWCIMAFASFMVVLLGLVDFDEIGRVIDLDVILFLIGMFSLVGLANSSGLLELISLWFISIFRRRITLIYGSSILFGVLSAFAVNDTVALMGPPIAYTISKVAGIDPKFMFLLLAFSLTIGSVMTPIGNPQNLLIAIESGIGAPFITFITRLTIPTILNILLTTYVMSKIFKVKDSEVRIGLIPEEVLKNKRDAILAGLGIVITIALLIINDILELFGAPHIKYRGVIPFVVAAGIYLLTTNPRNILSEVDWGTIVFFITMFITMEGIWSSGVLQPLLSLLLPTKEYGIGSILRITLTSLLLSQLLSNVPFVKLFISYMNNLGYTGSNTVEWLTLAMSSTIAGNLTILGAASNVIILEVLETRMKSTITFVEFLKIGSIITVLNISVYLIFGLCSYSGFLPL
jgi:Na+/H+ antiporter NhaD/arsenite permease-like protein